MTHYDHLQVVPNASAEVIRGAYKFLAQKWHPDKHPKNESEAQRVLQDINEAYAVLSNPVRRLEYDNYLAAQKKRAKNIVSKKEGTPTHEPTAGRNIRRTLLGLGVLLLSLTVLAAIKGLMNEQANLGGSLSVSKDKIGQDNSDNNKCPQGWAVDVNNPRACVFAGGTTRKEIVAPKGTTITGSCEFKNVMTNQDFINCGRTPPK